MDCNYFKKESFNPLHLLIFSSNIEYYYMQIMKKTQLLLFTGLIAFSAGAQKISPSVLNSAGGSYTSGINIFEWSFGEMTLVNTFTTANLIVSQGVLQSNSATTSVKDPKQNNLAEVSIYPNPANDMIYIQSTAKDGYLLSYSLCDAVGKTIEGKDGTFTPGCDQNSISMKDLAAGIYFLHVCGKTHSGTYQIQKIN